jgi:hypothetical protein
MSDEWLRERATHDRQQDEATARTASDEAERQQNRIRVVNEHLPGLLKELVRALQRKVALYNDTRGKQVLSVEVNSGPTDGDIVITVQRVEGARWAYVIDAKVAQGELTSRETTSRRMGGQSEGSGSLTMTVKKDGVSFAFGARGGLDVEQVADEVIGQVLKG